MTSTVPDVRGTGPGPAAGTPVSPAAKDWVTWHGDYADPASALSVRLAQVRARLSDAITQAPPGPVRVLSLCAGQGHDVIGVLPTHPRREDVTAVLVEFDGSNVAQARDAAADAGLSQVEIRHADASEPANFTDALPADVLLLCGIFGNVHRPDVRRLVTASASMCRLGGTVIWTRHTQEPDLTPRIRGWFAACGFEELVFEQLGTVPPRAVAVHRLRRAPSQPQPPTERLFTFRQSKKSAPNR